MNKKRIGICTLFTAYNYGSALQAYALKETLIKMNYDVDIIKLKGSIIKGRDFRLKKAIIISLRTLLYSKNKKNVIKSYKYNNKNNINKKTLDEFDYFYAKMIKPKYYSYINLKARENKKYYAFICGSDQIWNSTALYVDPFYYLRFTKKEKRIAYAPSFGKSYIPKYNLKLIKKYLNDFSSISIREKSGRRIIEKIINKEVPICLDPTLLIPKEEWINNYNLNNKNSNKEVLVYFLNDLNQVVINDIKQLKKEGYKINYLNNSNISKENIVYGGPITFLKNVYKSEYILTDSFHGVAFAINFNKKFYVYERNYLNENQSTRILSLLDILKLKDKYIKNKRKIDFEESFNYKRINKIIEEKRNKSINYLKNSLKNI